MEDCTLINARTRTHTHAQTHTPGGGILWSIGAAMPGIITGGPIPGMTGGVYIRPIAWSILALFATGSSSTDGLATPRYMDEETETIGREDAKRAVVM